MIIARRRVGFESWSELAEKRDAAASDPRSAPWAELDASLQDRMERKQNRASPPLSDKDGTRLHHRENQITR